jgi:hypothetical protein
MGGQLFRKWNPFKNPLLDPAKHWLTSEGKETLYDISNWDSIGNWESWNLGEVPPQMTEDAKQLLQRISCSAPVHLTKADERSWGKEGYTVKSGYKQLLEDNDIPPKSAIWREIWNPNSPPKINIFCWQLAHNKILTGDNLNKRGFSGPFRCALCNNSLENSEHLFLNCNFTRQVMNCMYKELAPNVANPTNTRSLLGKWAKQYKGSLKGKQKFSIVWKASIKFVCWQIWLTRNKKIFKEKTITPQVVAMSAISQISEYISSKKWISRKEQK